MPLRDHFRPPLTKYASWEGFHGGWPAFMVQSLNKVLPEGFRAAPRVRLGAFFEIDIGTHRGEDSRETSFTYGGNGGAAVATMVSPQPSLAVEAELPAQDEYEVLVYDDRDARRLVAAIELVSPGNKDRLENRDAFLVKCISLLQQDVCVSIVDPVTIRSSNLYADLLSRIDRSDPSLGASPPALYAVTCRWRPLRRRGLFESWFHPLALGQPLPTLPIWLSPEQSISLDLEPSYEETCKALRLM